MKPPNVHKVGSAAVPDEIIRKVDELTKSVQQMPEDLRPQWVKCASGAHEATPAIVANVKLFKGLSEVFVCVHCYSLYVEESHEVDQLAGGVVPDAETVPGE